MKNTIKILIIDDSQIDRMVVRTHFMHVFDQANIAEAIHGEEALSFLESCTGNFPDLILVDINMPIMDGFKFLKKYEEVFWKEHPNTLVYMISSSRAKQDVEMSNSFASIQDLLTKPLDREKAKSLRNTVMHAKHSIYGTSPS